MKRFYSLLVMVIFTGKVIGQIEVYTFKEYNDQFGQYAAQKVQKDFVIELDKTRQWRPGLQDLISYRLSKNLPSLESFSTKEPFFSGLVRLGEKKSPNLLLYEFQEFKRDSMGFSRISMELNAKEGARLESHILTTLSKVNFAKMNPPFNGFGFGIPSFKRDGNRKNLQEFLLSLPDTCSKINLTGFGLYEVPKEVYRFKNLKELVLAENNLKSIPKKIWKLKKLEKLDLSKNELEDSFLNIRRNRHLKILNVQFNYLSKAPRKMHKLKDLHLLLLGNNLLTSFKDQKLRRMSSLRVVNLYNATLDDLPASIKKWRNIEELDLYHNHMQMVDFDFSELPHLKVLALSHNRLWKIPDGISDLKKLEFLYLHHNLIDKITSLPENLKHVDLGYNNLLEVPGCIIKLQSLEELELSEIQLEKLPKLALFPESLKVLSLQNNLLVREKGEELISSLKNKGITVY